MAAPPSSQTIAEAARQCHDCQCLIERGESHYAGVPVALGLKAHLCLDCHAKRFPATALVAAPGVIATSAGTLDSAGFLRAVLSESPPIADQPPPTPERADQPAVWDLVIADMQERDRVGRQRYGTPLQPHNGRDPLVDAYQEALDLVVYLRQAICERDSR